MALGHRVLVPLDGSPFAERVLPLARTLAAHAGGTLHLVGVHVPILPPSTPPSAAAMVTDSQDRARGALDAYLDRTAAGLRQAGARVETELRTGLVDVEIFETCDHGGCDLIAMATHGRGGFRRLWLGSTADRVVRGARVPVLLVSARGVETGAELEPGGLADPPRDVRTVIMAVDGSAFAEQVLVPATALGEAFSADYILFRSVPAPAVVGVPAVAGSERIAARLTEHDRTEAKRHLDLLAGDLEQSGFAVAVTVVEEPEPVSVLLRLAEATDHSVIALTTHGRGGFRRAVLGSVADKVVRASTRPVLLVRPVSRP